MPLLHKRPSSPEHWSKDFAEHLRTVHFALVAVSVGLIILLSSSRYDPKSAATQLARVNHILGLWSDAYKDQDIFNRFVGFPSPQSLDYSEWFRGEVQGKISMVLWFHLAQPNLFECSELDLQYTQLNSSIAPRTIGQFATWWNGIALKPMVVDSIKKINPHGTLSTAKVVNGKDSFVRVADIQLGNIAKTEVSGTPSELTLDGSTCQTDVENSADRPSLQGESEGYHFTFDVARITRADFDQSYVAFEFGGQVGDFSTVFRDLAEAARDREDSDLATLTSLINAEALRGDDVFEAFGIKFPSKHITGWGMVLLVCVQLYFVMYLKRLSHRLERNDPGWDVPWMAMDESLMARAMLAVSVVALPIAASALVFYRAESAWFSNGFTRHMIGMLKVFNWSNRLNFVLIPIGILSSVALSVLAWHYRPKLTEPVPEPEVLEDQGSGI